VVSRSVAYDGDAIRLFVRNEVVKEVVARVESSGFASFPVSHSAIKYPALLEVSSAHASYDIELRDLSAAFSLVQLLPEGKILVVSSRCRRFNDGTQELNAWIYDATGALHDQFLLGDGIQHVQCDKSGNIWVGYFDEGVYGNFGWGSTGGAAPIGAAGLVCFNTKGETLWEYQPVSGTDFISDVYALNVFGNEAWVYYYTDFPIVRIKGDRSTEAWTTKTSGGHAFAVGHGKILLFGGYNNERTSCRWLRLGNREASTEETVTLSLPDGGNLSEAVVSGRGHILHVIVNNLWYQFSTASLS
jgi:hypothetical protein